MTQTPRIFKRHNKPDLAFRKTESTDKGKSQPTIVFLGGFRSDMEGTKATHLEQNCIEHGQPFLRFDYSGHGSSGGVFNDLTLSDWTQDAIDIISSETDGDLILIGSSMGGWISFLVAEKMQKRVKAIIGLAAAPDFTRSFTEKEFTPEMLQALHKTGYVDLPNDYSDEPYRITKKLIDDGEEHCFLDTGLDLSIPITLIQGMKDTDVEWQTAHRIKNRLTSCDINVILLEHGDHRLSKPEELSLIDQSLEDLVEKITSVNIL